MFQSFEIPIKGIKNGSICMGVREGTEAEKREQGPEGPYTLCWRV